MKLSSGRDVDANQGIVGIDEQLRVYEGYDGGLREADIAPRDYNEEPMIEAERYTKAEAMELADMMIARWTRYREAHAKRA